ncbi:CinA family protein [Paraburkholderia adhaesiva]|uniref:CinA family protein n=1 Tax=Paraburkholderia adhaesiva TaxID=2883244 RepID=UPI001F1C171D|nr:CinA family protein [Paraburkholderia adhaesiva]
MNIAKQIVGYLKSRGLVLASVETCTAGRIAAMLADVPGATDCLDFGLIVHSPCATADLPGVRASTAEQCGLISEAVARELAEGVLAQRAGHAGVVVVSLGLPAPPDDASVPVVQCLAWACVHRGQTYSAGETVRLCGRRGEILRSIARRALLGVPRFVDATLSRAD